MRGYVVYWLWGLWIDPESVFPFEKPTEWQRVLNVDGLFSYFLGVSTNQYFNILWDSRSIISLLNWWNFVDFMKSWYLEIDTCLIGVSNLNCAKVDVMLAWLCFFWYFCYIFCTAFLVQTFVFCEHFQFMEFLVWTLSPESA